MNPRLPAATGRQVLRALLKAGFIVDRIVGSHHILAHPDDPGTFHPMFSCVLK